MILTALFAALPLAQEPQPKPKPDGSRLVKVALVADRAEIRPGATFTLAVKLTIEKGWHVYWQNPGDAGAPTLASVHAPKGFTIGELEYPSPEREESAGDIVSFVHKDEMVILCDVKAPADLAAGSSVALGVDCRWLVCQETCYPGSSKAELTLPTAPATDADARANEPPRERAGNPERDRANESERDRANAQDFQRWRARLPRPFEELQEIAGFYATTPWTSWKDPFVVIVPRALALDFFPYNDDPPTLNMSGLQLERNPQACTMKLRFEPPAGYEGPAYRFRGVIAVRTEKGETCYRIGGALSAPRATHKG
jgi:DsbC/DsbD-like thiol-disulfide interchange protein